MWFRRQPTQYFSQIGEDDFLDNHVFGGMKNGVFIDIGAHDGVTFSNTYFFEKNLGWTGICVEPLPEMFEKLKKNRTAKCINACISDKVGTQEFLAVSGSGNAEMFSGLLQKYDDRHLQRIKREIQERHGDGKVIFVQSLLISDILKENKLTHIDYCNIDTEGGELDILKTIDFSACTIDCLTVEDLYGDKKLHAFMKKLGYKMLKKLDIDCVFIRDDFHVREKVS